MGWAPRRYRAPIACPCHQKRSAPFRLLPRLFSGALPVRRYLTWRWHWLPAGVMRRSVSFGEKFRRSNVAHPSHSVALPFAFGESAGVIFLKIQNEPLNETPLAPARHRSKKAQRFLRAALELKSNGRASASISSVVVHSLSAFVIERKSG